MRNGNDLKLSKQLINRFYDPQKCVRKVSVRNGYMRRATAIVTYSGGKSFEISVTHTHPLFSAITSVREDEKVFISWECGSGYSSTIPDIFAPIADELLEMCKISNEQAATELKELSTSLAQSLQEMGFTS